MILGLVLVLVLYNFIDDVVDLAQLWYRPGEMKDSTGRSNVFEEAENRNGLLSELTIFHNDLTCKEAFAESLVSR